MTMAETAPPVSRRPPGTPVLVIDDHTSFAIAVCQVLQSHGLEARHLRIDGGLATTAARIPEVPRGVALLDPVLGTGDNRIELDGVALIEPLRRQGWTVLMIHGHRDEVPTAAGIAAGATGVVDKSAPLELLLATLDTARKGGQILSADERRRWVERHRTHQADRQPLARRLDRLSTTEREILELLLQGHRASEVAQRRVVPLTTVRTQIRAILTKLQVGSQLEAVALLTRDSRWRG